jgi:hypothetical protein
MTRSHVAEGERTIAHQTALIAEIQAKGRDASAALTMLRQFHQIQAEHIAHRDRLEAML